MAITFAIGMALASAQAQAQAPDTAKQQLEDLFATPPKAARPMIRWWWPGGDVEDNTIRSEIAAFDAAGFGGVEVQPFDEGMGKTTPVQKARIDEFATPAFFAHLKVAAQATRDRGTFLDYTFGSGWPSGGAFVTPEHASLELASTVKDVVGPTRDVKLDLPMRGGFYGAGPARQESTLPEGWDQRIAAREKIIAVLAWPGSGPDIQHSKGIFGQPITRTVTPGELTGEPIDLTDRLRGDGTLDWSVPAGHWQIFVYRQLPTLQRVTGGVGGGAQLVIDHFSRSAFDAYASHILPRELPSKADGLRAVFIDSLEVRVANWWSDDFLARFKAQHGYDLKPYLPFIEQVGWPSPFDNSPSFDKPGIARKVRDDYRQTVKDLIRERFFEPFEKAVHARGLLTRLQAHGAPGDLLTLYGEADIPETEDLFEGVSPNFLKMASSAADIYGRPITSAEAFIIPGTDGYGTTPQLVKERADALLVNGANQLIAHGAPYPYQTDVRPFGWYPWGGVFSSMLGTRNPLLPYFQPVNAYIARLQALFQKTTTLASIAIWRTSGPYPDERPSGGPADTPEPAINSILRHAGYDWLHIDRTALERSTIAAGEVHTPGSALFKAIVVPKPSDLTASDHAALAAAIAQGVRVYLAAPTGTNFSARSVELVRAGAQRLDEAEALPAALAGRGIAPVIDFAGSTPLPFIAKRFGSDARLLFVTNPHSPTRIIHLAVPKGMHARRWNAWDGTIHEQPVQNRTITFEMPAGTSLLVSLEHGTSNEPPLAAPSSPSRTIARLARWEVKVSGYDEDGQAVAIARTGEPPQDWSAWSGGKAVSGQATYRTQVHLTAAQIAARPVLDLGKVGGSARISINGCSVIAPYAPYTVGLGGLASPGFNTVTVEVANSPLNATRNDPGGIGAGPSKPDRRPAGLASIPTVHTGTNARWQGANACSAKPSP